MKNYIVTEGVESTWHYHLSEEDDAIHSLCGKKTMRTSLGIEKWGTVTHLKEKYCPTCLRISQGKEEKV